MTTAGLGSHWKPRDTLANRLRLLRAELHLSQREFGQRCQIPASQIQSIEDGNSPRGLDTKVKKIVLAFGVDRDWLMWGGELASPDGPEPTRNQTTDKGRVTVLHQSRHTPRATAA